MRPLNTQPESIVYYSCLLIFHNNIIWNILIVFYLLLHNTKDKKGKGKLQFHDKEKVKKQQYSLTLALYS